ncbi:MAG: DUF4249 domain-containing protein [Pedobacter sp.]|jgi:hypothetical protein|uniref:DUF4249 domain-containing protein n=1 Tax=Pedobacter sp. TaxID=1411316 RepID=UPI0035677753
MEKKLKILFMLAILLIIGCKESFNPKVTSTNNNLLVVEGFINTGTDSTFIKLSRTVVIANKNTVNPETGATVTIESEANESYLLKEEIPGVYNAPPLNLNATKKYRINIKTTKGVNYLSSFIEAKVSPPIDNVGYEIRSNGVQLHVSTHDSNNKTIFYRWEFEDAWIFYAKNKSNLIYKPGQGIVSRQATLENIYQCWGSGKSNAIILGSSAKLSQDVIHQSPLILIPSNSEKLEEKYSILVKQYALTKEAYDFWENLRKNTENLGSIFDAQPSQLTGNVHNTADTSEPVIGFIGAGTIQQQRIYVTNDKLPNWIATFPYDCGTPEEVLPAFYYRFNDGTFIPIEFSSNGITGTRRECADCTLRGANKKPNFWQ